MVVREKEDAVRSRALFLGSKFSGETGFSELRQLRPIKRIKVSLK